MTIPQNRLNPLFNMFSLELYQSLSKDDGNLVVSPLGPQILLAMTLEGANDKTAVEISEVLHHSKHDKEVLEGYKATINSLESPYLQIATGMFVEKSLDIKGKFKSLTSKYFMSDIIGKDFSKSPEECRHELNKWVEEKTNHTIKDLLPQGSVNASVKLVMVNAVHFYAQWKTRFAKEHTVDMLFYVTPNKKVNVKMMVTCKPFLFLECPKLDAKIVKLLYADETFGMIILLPNKIEGLSEIENKLKSIDLFKELSNHSQHCVNLMLPRFKIEKTMELNDFLIQQMPTAFTEEANLSGISDGPLNISKITQKAFIEVNETGTEATATTGILMTPRSRKIVQDMKCDHPFFFQIVKDDLIIFQGALTEPEPEKRSKILEPEANTTNGN